MKRIFLIAFILLSTNVFSQNTLNKQDTSVICLPIQVGKQILIDLNELDRLKEQTLLDQQELKELEKKIIKQDGLINILELKDQNNEVIIKNTEEKVNLLESENKDLKKDIKKLKTKNVIVEIVSGSLVSALTYLLVLKQ